MAWPARRQIAKPRRRSALASDWRDLRFLAHAPWYLTYKKLRLDWFPAEAFYENGGRPAGLAWLTSEWGAVASPG